MTISAAANNFEDKIEGYENITVIEKDGEKFLVLNEKQHIQLADYISEVETESENLEAKLEQAEKELDKAYDDRVFTWQRADDMLTGAGVAALIILIAE